MKNKIEALANRVRGVAGLLSMVHPLARHQVNTAISFEENVCHLMALTGRDYEEIASEMKEIMSIGYTVDGAYQHIYDKQVESWQNK